MVDKVVYKNSDEEVRRGGGTPREVKKGQRRGRGGREGGCGEREEGREGGEGRGGVRWTIQWCSYLGKGGW